MTDFTHKHYVPILKGRAGEYRALREIGPKAGLTPMIDVPPIGWDFEKNEPAKTVDDHLARLTCNIEKCWDTHHPIFFDLYMIPESEVMANGRHPLVYVFDSLRAVGAGSFFSGVKAIPVTGLGRRASYQTAVRQIAAKDGRGVCLRLESKDFEDIEALEGEIAKVLNTIRVAPTDVDLVLDFKAIESALSGPTTLAVRGILKELPMLSKWRTLTLAASAFPRNLSDVTPELATIFRREEWIMWRALVTGKNKVPRLPAFGDYGIRHPHFAEAEVDPKVLRTAANIRYTTTNDWLALKGRNPKTPSVEQPQINCDALCRDLIDREEYCGATFSWGDSWISACARGVENNGCASTWTAVGTSHHVAFVRSQIASLPGS